MTVILHLETPIFYNMTLISSGSVPSLHANWPVFDPRRGYAYSNCLQKKVGLVAM